MIRAEELKQFYMFANWSEASLTRIFPYFNKETLTKDQLLFKENDPPEKMYFVQTGCIELRMMLNEAENTVLGQMREGDMFGELALLDEQPRSATAVAREQSSLLSLSREKLEDFLRQDNKETTNKLLLSILKELSFRMRNANDEIRRCILFA